MININKLKGTMAEKGITQGELALSMNLSRTTMSFKIRKGKFSAQEANKIVDILQIPKDLAVEIFLPSVLHSTQNV